MAGPRAAVLASLAPAAVSRLGIVTLCVFTVSSSVSGRVRGHTGEGICVISGSQSRGRERL